MPFHKVIPKNTLPESALQNLSFSDYSVTQLSKLFKIVFFFKSNSISNNYTIINNKKDVKNHLKLITFKVYQSALNVLPCDNTIIRTNLTNSPYI